MDTEALPRTGFRCTGSPLDPAPVALSDRKLPSTVANIAAASPTSAPVGSGWRWDRDWGPAWDSPDVEVMAYVANCEASDGR